MVFRPLCIELCVYSTHQSTWRAMKKCTSSVEENYVVSNCTDLNCVGNNKPLCRVKFFWVNPSANTILNKIYFQDLNFNGDPNSSLGIVMVCPF